MSSTTTSTSKAVPGGGCVDLARSASSAFGDGITRFMNPPVEPSVWGDFYNDIDSKISRARQECNCSSDACGKANAALMELRSQLSSADAAVRGGGPPPSDLVQGQEKINNLLDEASAALGSGK